MVAIRLVCAKFDGYTRFLGVRHLAVDEWKKKHFNLSIRVLEYSMLETD